MARNVLDPEEVKYFVSNMLRSTLKLSIEGLLWIAFSCHPIADCFKQANNEPGMDHFEVRGWRSTHHHFYISQLSHLSCSRVRQELPIKKPTQSEYLTAEVVHKATSAFIARLGLGPSGRTTVYQKEADKITYHLRRNQQARKSHTKPTLQQPLSLEIEIDKLPLCEPKDTS